MQPFYLFLTPKSIFNHEKHVAAETVADTSILVLLLLFLMEEDAAEWISLIHNKRNVIDRHRSVTHLHATYF